MITELDYVLNCAAIEIDTTNARAELAALRTTIAQYIDENADLRRKLSAMEAEREHYQSTIASGAE